MERLIDKIIWIIDYFTSKNDYIHKDKSHIATMEKLDKWVKYFSFNLPQIYL